MGVLHACKFVCQMYAVPMRSEEGVNSFGTGITHNCELSCGC